MSRAKNPLEISKTSVFLWVRVCFHGAVLFLGLHEGLFVRVAWTIFWSAYGGVIQQQLSASETQKASQRGYDEMGSVVLKEPLIMKALRVSNVVMSCCFFWGAGVWFPPNLSSVSRLSHDTTQIQSQYITEYDKHLPSRDVPCVVNKPHYVYNGVINSSL